MIKVKEYLDANFYSHEPSTAELKKNGHYCVMGSWGLTEKPDWQGDLMWFRCNNETLQICAIMIGGKSVSKYGYLMTYEHIPRGEPDENGYYARSLDEEVIQYIQSYLNIINREKKLKRIIEK